MYAFARLKKDKGVFIVYEIGNFLETNGEISPNASIVNLKSLSSMLTYISSEIYFSLWQKLLFSFVISYSQQLWFGWQTKKMGCDWNHIK